MKAIIIEDEKLNADHLVTLLGKIDASIQVIDIIDSVKKSIAKFESGLEADILFVDIHLADGLSFELFKKVQINTPVIFTTAYDEYAIQAFKLNSVDYLLKPISIQELEQAINKFKRINTSNASIQNLLATYQLKNKEYKNRFMVKMGETISSIKVEHIAHFVTEDKMTLLVTSENKRYALDYTLEELEDLVSPQLFFRINRKVIIHVNHAQKSSLYFNSRLKVSSPLLTDDNAVVSRERVNDFKAWLDS
jgi:DNA-binding LytR/AlgR family response regulator